MTIYKLQKINSINETTASVHLVSSKKEIDIAIPRNQCYIGKEYINVYGTWEKLSKYTIKIKKIKFRNEKSGFTLALVDIIKNTSKDDIPTDVPMLRGFFPVLYDEEQLEVVGYWDSSNKGLYFVSVESKRTLSIEAVSIKNYLEAAIKGISSSMLEKIINHFGAENVIDIIKNTPNKLGEIKGIGPKAIVKISDGVAQACVLENVFSFMSRFDIPTSSIIAIYKEFGLASEDLVKKNPYKIASSFLLSLSDADKIGKYIGFDYDNPERLKALIIHYLRSESENNGDMFSKLTDIIKNLTNFSNKNGYIKAKNDFALTEIWPILQDLNKDKYIFIEEHPVDGTCIYHAYYKVVEDKICYRLEELLHSINTRPYYKEKVNSLIDKQEKDFSIKIDKKQKEAIHMAIKNKFSILTGGPGTGKTQTINSIIKILETLYPEIEIGLCAPTGRASKRMSELTGKDAYTIHKKLKCTPFTAVTELDSIDSDFLIVDEASMIDADLFYKLLISIKDSSSVLFVGDYHQLPSVGVGLILRDLIESDVIPKTELTKVFRQKGESKIIDLSRSISEGKHIEEDSDFLKPSKDLKIVQRKDNISIQNQIILTISSAMNSKIVSKDDIQVLVPINHGDIGMVILNQRIQNLVNPDIGQNKYELSAFMELREGDKVMQTKNNYDIGVFNGSIGHIKKIDYSEGVKAICEFDNEEKIYDGFEAIEELVLAYAITIHKSQGSEFPLVIMPMSKSYGQILSRNLLYTGVTRAKDYLRIIGDIEAINMAIDRINVVSRNSHIKEKLIKIMS